MTANVKLSILATIFNSWAAEIMFCASSLLHFNFKDSWSFLRSSKPILSSSAVWCSSLRRIGRMVGISLFLKTTQMLPKSRMICRVQVEKRKIGNTSSQGARVISEAGPARLKCVTLLHYFLKNIIAQLQSKGN